MNVEKRKLRDILAPADQMSATPYIDQFLIAAIYIAGLFGFGFVAAPLVWLVWSRRSRFARYHAVQAFLFELNFIIDIFVLFGCWLVLLAGVLGTVPLANAFNRDTIRLLFAGTISFIPLLFAIIVIIFFLASIAGRIIAAYHILRGRDFRHPGLGKLAKRMVSKYNNPLIDPPRSTTTKGPSN